GGYIGGREDLIHKSANRLTAPGRGRETGATLHMLQEMYQGIFMAPHIVGESLQGAVFTARLMQKVDIYSTPFFDTYRTDIIQSVFLEEETRMLRYCQLIQENSPNNAYVSPYPSEMPGYDDKVIMSAGTVIHGASIELSIDGPIRAPHNALMQG